MASTTISWDWKSRPELRDLKTALEPLGVRVYEDPMSDGGDWFGFIFSDVDLTPDEVRTASDEHWDRDEDES